MISSLHYCAACWLWTWRSSTIIDGKYLSLAWFSRLFFRWLVGIIKWVNSPAGFILCCFYRFLSSLTRLLFKEPASQQFRAAVTNNSNNNSEVIICIVWWLKEASTVAAQRRAQYTYLDNFSLFAAAALPTRSCFHCVALAFCCRSSIFALRSFFFNKRRNSWRASKKKLILRFALASLLIINIHASATTHLSKPPASTRSYFFYRRSPNEGETTTCIYEAEQQHVHWLLCGIKAEYILHKSARRTVDSKK